LTAARREALTAERIIMPEAIQFVTKNKEKQFAADLTPIANLTNYSESNTVNKEKSFYPFVVLDVVGNCKVSQKHRMKNATSYGGAKQARGGYQPSVLQSYRRMLLVGGLVDRNGSTAYVIETGHETERNWWGPSRPATVIGDSFVAMDVKKESPVLSDDTPILEFPMPLEKLEQPLFQTRNVPFRAALENSTRFFVLQSAQIKVTSANFVIANCKGDFCDRRTVKPNHVCGCYTTKHNSDMVLEVDVTILNSSIPMVESWRSYAFTKSLVNGVLPAEVDPATLARAKIEEFRATFKTFVNHVNGNGGWAILGYHRRGTVVDASSSNVEDDIVSSVGDRVHLSVVKPAEPDKVDGELKFKTEKLTEEE